MHGTHGAAGVAVLDRRAVDEQCVDAGSRRADSATRAVEPSDRLIDGIGIATVDPPGRNAQPVVEVMPARTKPIREPLHRAPGSARLVWASPSVAPTRRAVRRRGVAGRQP